jgi:hypothetical protein
MKTESQDSVRLLFALPREEKIFDDFGCSLVDGLSYHGRIYITENYICFNSNILGIKTNWALGLPGKVAPKAAAKYMKRIIEKTNS